MNCAKCSTELVEKARFCHSCGAFAANKLSFMNGVGRKKRLIEALIEKVEELSDKLDAIEARPAQVPVISPYGGSGTVTWPSQPIGGGMFPSVPIGGGITVPASNPIWISSTSSTGAGMIYNSSGTSSDAVYTISSASSGVLSFSGAEVGTQAD